MDSSAMEKLIGNWNGEIKPLDEIKVSVLDRAFLFGDAVYEVIRVYRGIPFRLDDHLERLAQSMAKVDLRGVDVAAVRSRVHETVEASGLREALVYIQVTRGEAPRTHHYPETYRANVLIYASPFDDPFADLRQSGAAVVTYKDVRWGRNDIKSTSLAANCMAAQYAREHGCLEVVFIDSNGMMTEGSHTSLFGIKDGKLIVAPSSANVLPGITKRQVLQLADDCGIETVQRRLRQEELQELDELFLSGTPEEIIPIVKLDEQPVGDGKPGPVVDRLYRAFRQALQSQLDQRSAGPAIQSS